MSDPLTFAELRQADLLRNKEWDPSSRLSGLFFAVELGGEMAEMGKVLNTIKKIERAALGLRGSTATLDHLAEELADVVDLVAIKYNIDLGAAVRAKFDAVSDKLGLTTKLACTKG